MTTFDDATARKTVINFCIEGGMTPIQNIKTDRYKNVSKQLVYSDMANLIIGGQTVLLVDDRHARIKINSDHQERH